MTVAGQLQQPLLANSNDRHWPTNFQLPPLMTATDQPSAILPPLPPDGEFPATNSIGQPSTATSSGCQYKNFYLFRHFFLDGCTFVGINGFLSAQLQFVGKNGQTKTFFFTYICRRKFELAKVNIAQMNTFFFPIYANEI